MTNLCTPTSTLYQTLMFSTDTDPMRVLAVSPPFLPGYKPLPDGVAGANRHMVNSDRLGLLFYIFPYLNMSATDRINVYFSSRPTPVASLDVGLYKDQLVPVHILASILEQLYATPTPMPNELLLHFTVDRISGNPEKSPSLPLLYKPFGPGESDTRPDLPNNQGLALPAPSETIIDQTVIDEGMFVTVAQYEHQAVGDMIYLTVGPLILEMQVTALGDLLFELTPDFLATLPNTDRVSLSYEIVDIVQNESGWSSAVVLTLKPTVVLLSAPIVNEADAVNNVNYDALAGADATVLLTGLFNANDVVVLTLVMFTLAGDRVERTITQDVKATARSLQFPIENAYVQNAIRGSIMLSYTQRSAGITRLSKSCTVTVSGLALPAPAPQIDEQEGSELPSDTALAHVRIARYWPLATGATVQLFWQVTGSDGVIHLYIFGQIINDVSQEIIFTVGSEYIERFADSPLTVLYKIENPGKSLVQSESLQLAIGMTKTQVPTITSVINADTKIPVPDGGTTTAGNVAISGSASPEEWLVIFNGTTTVTEIQADSKGNWSHSLSVQASNIYQLTVQAQSGSKPVSNAWSFSVVAKLSMGANHSQSATPYYIVGGNPPQFPPTRGLYTRTAQGGVLPYRYKSSNPSIALVDPNTGTVHAGGNGSAVITVTDGVGNSASYTITFSGIQLIALIPSITWTPAHQPSWVGSGLNVQELSIVREIYSRPGIPATTALGWPRGPFWSSVNVILNPDGTYSPKALAYDLSSLTEVQPVPVHGATFLPAVRRVPG